MSRTRSRTRIDAKGKAYAIDPPCDACGWHCKKVWEFSNNKCDPKAGKHADRLVKLCSKLPGVTASKGGAGYGSIHVEIIGEDDESIVFFFEANTDGTIEVRSVFWRNGDTVDEAAELVAALAIATVNINKRA